MNKKFVQLRQKPRRYVSRWMLIDAEMHYAHFSKHPANLVSASARAGMKNCLLNFGYRFL